MKGKRIVITGATSGIGYETAKALAVQGAGVTIVSRDETKGAKISALLRRETGNPAIDFVVADLASREQIRQAAAELLKRHPVIDVLVNNAGTWHSDFGLTEEHIERMFAVNHLAYFLFTHCLLDGLMRPASARVINVASDAHFHGKIHDDINLRRHYHGLTAYAQSKLANVLFTYEFARRNPGLPITMNAVQPGLVKTDIGIKHTRPFHSLAWRFRRLSGITPREGAATSVFLASSPSVEGITGKYWDHCKAKSSSRLSYDRETAGKLWETCEALCGINDYFRGGRSNAGLS